MEWCRYCGEGDGVCSRCAAREELAELKRTIRSILEAYGDTPAAVRRIREELDREWEPAG